MQSTSAAKKRRLKPRHQTLVNLAKIRGANSILEIGSGVGELGLMMTEQGFNYVGVEPDQMRAESCQEAGLDVRAISLEDLPSDVSVDLIVIDNVLEHVLDPVGLLRLAKKYLRPDGAIIVVVPNRNDVRRIVPSWRKKHLWIPGVHVNYFTKKSLRRTMSLSGLSAFSFPASSFTGTNSIARHIAGLMNSTGVFPFGIYLGGTNTERS